MFAPCNGNVDSNFWFQSDCLFYFISQICVRSVSLTNIIECILNEYFIDKEQRENYDLSLLHPIMHELFTAFYIIETLCIKRHIKTIS